MSKDYRTMPLRRVVIAATVGTAVEYYDFFVYATPALLYFGDLFFPTASPTASAAAAFATYAVSLIARPIGGVIFGHYGDRIGRRTALASTIVICGLGTFLIGVMPTYQKIGAWAPLMLVMVRIIQGLGVGGEQAAAVLIVAEHAPRNRRGLFASCVQLGAPIGFLIPTGLFALLSGILSNAEMLDWGWRVPFLLSLPLVTIGLYVRLRIDESPLFKSILKTKLVATRPVVEVVRRHWAIIVKGIFAKQIESCTFTLYSTIILIYTQNSRLDVPMVLRAIVVAVSLELLTIPLAGLLTDKLGRRVVYLMGVGLQVALVVPFFLAINTGSRLLTQIVMILVLTVGHSLCYAPQASMFPELFPARVRCSGVALVWQVGALVGSGFLGIAAVRIIGATAGQYYGLAIYVAVLCAAAVLALRLLPETAPLLRPTGDMEDWNER